MSITYRFSIDGVIISEPENLVGWDKLVTSIKRDDSDLKGLLVSQDVELQFRNDLYRDFKDKYFNDGICSESTLLIEQSFDGGVNFTRLHEGIIKLRDVVLSDMLRGEAKTKTNDNSFFSRINNNKSIKTNPKGQWTKNGLPIGVGNTPVDFAVDFFDPATGAFFDIRNMLRLDDVMRYLVLWMSDGEVEFQSDLLETDLQMMIQQGDVLRLNVDPIPYWEVSFADIYKNLKGLRDISYAIEYDANDRPILRLELASYFFNDTLATDADGNEIVFLNPTTLETKVKTSELYSQVMLGSEIIADFPYLEFPENIRFNGFKKEPLYILGQCNIDQTLDLVKAFAISSNDIEDCVVEGGVTSGDYDEDIFLVHVENINEGALTADAIGTNPFGGIPPMFYNMALRNSEIADSYFGVFQNGLVAGFLNFTANDFRATKQIATLHTLLPGHLIIDPPLDINPVTYEAEVDPGGNFNLATDFYTCPVSGFYTFNFYLRYSCTTSIGSNSTVRIIIIDNTGAALGETVVNGISFGINVPVLFSLSIFRALGDQVGTRIIINYATGNAQTGQFRVDEGTYFEATASPDTGGIAHSYDPQSIRSILMTFNYPLLPQTFNSILQNLRGKYTIQCDEIQSSFKGWIEQMKYDHKTEIANITLKTSVNSIGNEIPPSPDKLPAYQFIFSMATDTDQIDSFTYNTGLSTVAMTVALAQSITDIKAQILSAFGGAGIGVTDIVITRISLGGARFNYKIIIVNPNFTMDIIDVSGASTISSFFYY